MWHNRETCYDSLNPPNTTTPHKNGSSSKNTPHKNGIISRSDIAILKNGMTSRSDIAALMNKFNALAKTLAKRTARFVSTNATPSSHSMADLRRHASTPATTAYKLCNAKTPDHKNNNPYNFTKTPSMTFKHVQGSQSCKKPQHIITNL